MGESERVTRERSVRRRRIGGTAPAHAALALTGLGRRAPAPAVRAWAKAPAAGVSRLAVPAATVAPLAPEPALPLLAIGEMLRAATLPPLLPPPPLPVGESDGGDAPGSACSSKSAQRCAASKPATVMLGIADTAFT